MEVTAELLKPTNGIDEVAYGKFVAKTLKSYKRWRDQGRRDYAGWSDAECEEAARFYCGCYREQYRIFEAVTNF